MKVTPISTIKTNFNKINPRRNPQSVTNNISQVSFSGNEIISKINQANIESKPLYKLGLSSDELEKRTSPKALATKQLLDVNSEEYANLEDGDKKALKHLIKAAMLIDDIYLKQDNSHNIGFRNFLNQEIKKGNKDAEKTKQLFDGQKGICAVDNNSNMVYLAKGIGVNDGKAFYPDDLGKEEFHEILIDMLNNGKYQEVSDILNQHSVVERKGNELKSIDYTEKYKKEYKKIADELEKAAETSTNEDFNEYLRLQAKALRTNNPMLDAYADKKWAELQDTPLEFTLVRESYDDELTPTVSENLELKALLDKNGIQVYPKDSLGCRVGIVNKQGTYNILNVKKYLPIMAENMPEKDKYKQFISTKQDSKQTMVDADLLVLTGFSGACRGGIVIAENLPNDDKLSLRVLQGGRRNVYHRQIRTNNSPDEVERRQKKLNAILNPELHKYYNPEAHHWFTIGHENAHSLGPKIETNSLGLYKHIIEENKADMTSIAMLDILTNAGLYTEDQKKEIIVTFATDGMLQSKPLLSQTHRVRSIMQSNYLMKEGAISVSPDGILDINIDKVVPAAKKMLSEIIDIQLSNDFNKAEKFVKDNFVWTKEMDKIAENIKKEGKTLQATLKTPLADKILSD